MNLYKKLARLIKLPIQEKCYLVFLFICSIYAWYAVKRLPMHEVCKSLGNNCQSHQLSTLLSSAQQHKAFRIGKLMQAIARNLPWQCKCLAQAICVVTLCKYLQIPTVSYLGAKIETDNEETMKAHAWVSSGKTIIIGRESHRAYQIVASFSTLAN